MTPDDVTDYLHGEATKKKNLLGSVRFYLQDRFLRCQGEWFIVWVDCLIVWVDLVLVRRISSWWQVDWGRQTWDVPEVWCRLDNHM